MLLIAALLPAAATAQQRETCAACDAPRQACVAACRAAYFTIDPRRDECTHACAAAAETCRMRHEPACRSGRCAAPQ